MNNAMKKILFYNSIDHKLYLLLIVSFIIMVVYCAVVVYSGIDNNYEGVGKSIGTAFVIFILFQAIIFTCMVYLGRKIKKLMPDMFNSIDSRLKVAYYAGSNIRYIQEIEDIVNDSSILPYKIKTLITVNEHFIIEGNADVYVCEFLEKFNQNNKNNNYISKHQAFGSYSGAFIIIRDKQLNFNGKAVFLEKSFYEHGKAFSYYDNLVNVEPFIKIDNNTIASEFHTYFTDKTIAEKLCNTYTLDSIAYLYSNFEKNLSVSFSGNTVCLFFNNEYFNLDMKKRDELKKYIARIEGIIDLYYSLK